MRLRWLGIGGLELSWGGEVLLVDPCLSRIGFWRVWWGNLRADEELLARHLGRAEAILITHSHYDHLLDAPALARRTGARVFGSQNTVEICRLEGAAEGQLRRVTAGEALSAGGFAVRVYAARHRRIPFFGAGKLAEGLRPPLTARQYRLDESFSYRIEAGGRSVMVDAGSRAEDLEEADLLAVHPFYEEAHYRALLERVRARVVMPNHWDDFWIPLEAPLRMGWAPGLRRVDLGRFERMIRRIDPGVRVWVAERLGVSQGF